jgi:hypothetical protein
MAPLGLGDFEVAGRNTPLSSHQKVWIEGNVSLGEQFGRRKKNAVLWAAEENAKGHLCGCGCGQKMPITFRHYTYGLPKFLRGHNARVVCSNGVEVSTGEAGDDE